MKKNLAIRTGCLFIIPVALMLIFMVFSNGGFGFSSLPVILRQAMIPLVLAFGVAFSFVVGIFEMSVGAQVILGGIVGGILYRVIGPIGLWIGCIGMGLLGGLVMGIVYKFLRIPTMVISLGMMLLFEVIANVLTTGSGCVTIDADVASLGGAPLIFIIGGIAAVVFYFIYHKTEFGHGIRALGSNDYIAVNLGLNNNKLKVLTYVMGGAFYGLGGMLTLCYGGSIAAKMNLGSLSMMFPPIISVLIALQLMNLVNNFPATILVGAFSATVLASGMIAVGLPAELQDVMTGIFMIAIMIVSENSARISKKMSDRKIVRELYANQKRIAE